MKSLLVVLSAVLMCAQAQDAPKKKVYSQGQHNFWSFRAIKDPAIAAPSPIDALIRQKPANIGAALRDWVGSNQN